MSLTIKIVLDEKNPPLPSSPLPLNSKSMSTPELPALTLYSYWRSSSAWRVRVILALKNLPYTYEAVPLLQKKQQTDEFKGLNPMQQVPSLKVETADGKVHFVNQSLAIIDYLDAICPDLAVYSKDPLEKAYEQELSLDIVSGIQPIQNLNILLHIKELTGEDEKKMEWARKYITQGLVAIEAKIVHRALPGNNKTISPFHACLIPQLYNARRFGVDMTQFPTLVAIEDYCKTLPAFIAADPDNQPDANQL